jgi:hypothetical protein
MTKKIERLAVDLVANGEAFKRELAASQTKAQAWGRKVEVAIRLGAAAMVGATTASVALTRKSIDLADSIAKNAKAAGLGAETYQAWEFAASQSGIANEKFATSMERATKRIGEAARGTGAAREVLAKYNISVFDLQGNVRPTEDVLRDFADAMQKMVTPAERSAAAAAILGRDGARMGLLLAQGSAGIAKFEQKARDMGIVLDKELLTQAELASDQLDTMSRVVNANLIVAFKDLIPVVGGVAESFTNSLVSFTKFTDSIFGFSKTGKIQSEILGIQSDLKLFNERLIAEKEKLTSGSSLREVVEAAIGGGEVRAGRLRAIEKLEADINDGKTRLEDARKRLEEALKPARTEAGTAVEKPGKTYAQLMLEADQRAYARRLELAKEYSTNYLERTQALVEADQLRVKQQLKFEQELRDAKISIAESVFGTLGMLSKEGSKAQRVLLAAEKGAALVRATIALQEAIAKANALGFPANIPAIAQATSIGAGAIATIRSINIEGQAHAGLNNVPREGTYLLDRGERVVQPRQNQDLTDFLAQQDKGVPQIVIEFHRAPGATEPSVSQSFDGNGNLRVVVKEMVRQTIDQDIVAGRGVSTTLERTFSLRRKAV